MRAGYGKPNLISNFMAEPERRRGEETTQETEKEFANIMAQSIEQLTKQVQFYGATPNIVFSLEYRPAPKSSDIRGPIDFVLDANSSGNLSQAPQASSFQGLGGIDFNGYLDQKLEIERERNTLALERVNFQFEMRQKEKEIESQLKKVEEERGQLKELEREYQSHSNRAKNGFNMAFSGLLDKYLPAEETGLKGVESEIAGVPETPEEKMIQSIATHIHEKFHAIEDIKAIGILVQRFADQPLLFENYKQKINSNQL